MITPTDIACMQIIQAEKRVDEAHYHIANPPQPHPRSPLEEANFHIVDRAVTLNQAMFDYYDNILSFRV